MEKKLRLARDSESAFPSKLKKVVKSLTKKDDHISKLTEEGKDQYTFDWSYAKLDTLLQYLNDKLVDKEVNAEIL